MNIITVLFCFVLGFSVQIKSDLTFITEANPINANEDVQQDISSFTFKQVSETELGFTGLVRLYQLFISPQDVPRCNFTLSCSHFMIEAVQKHGIFHALLMTSDRLQRCIRAGRKYYTIDPKTGRAIDYPVETYYLGSSKKSSRRKQ